MKYIAKSTEDLNEIAHQLVVDFSTAKIIAFYGEMGVGKTTLIKEICTVLGVKETANSPTFSIVNEYLSLSGRSIYHFDFYRIKNENEVFDLGYEEYFYSNNYCFIEWPEKISNLLPKNTIKVGIELDKENNRLISVVR